MSEKRKPELVFIARITGKGGRYRRYRAELYPARLWPETTAARMRVEKYRVRANGKWFRRWKNAPKMDFMTLSEFFEIFRKGITNVRTNNRKARNAKEA